MTAAELVPLAAARRALAEADALPDLAHLIDYAETMRVAARRADLAKEAQRDWAVFSLEAQRKAGTLLADMPRQDGGDARRAALGNTALPSPARLQDVLETTTAGEAKMKAKRWQDVAAVPAEVFTEYTASAEEPTRARLLRLSRDAAARAAREAVPVPVVVDDLLDVRLGDFRTVLADLADVDAIVTDPPYPREFLPLLGDLAAWADKVLTPDGVLAVMFGQTHLPEVYRLLDGHRPYRWTLAYATPGAAYVSQARRVASNWKPVLVYGGGPRFSDVITTAGDDKAHHRWGQDYTGMATLVERLTAPGAHVVDPFLGGGTTAVAARNLGRRFTGADVDPEAVAETMRRLGEVAT